MATIGGPQFTGQVQGFAVGGLSFTAGPGAPHGAAPPQLTAADLQRIIAGAFVALQQLGNTWGAAAGGQAQAQTYQPFGSIQPQLGFPGSNIGAQTYQPFGNIQPGLGFPGSNIGAETYQPFGSIQPGLGFPGSNIGAETYQPFGSIQPGIQNGFGFPGIGGQTYESFGQPPMSFPGQGFSPYQQINTDPFAGAYSALNPFAAPTNATDAVYQFALANMDPTEIGQFLSIQTPMDAPPIQAQPQVQQQHHHQHKNHGHHHHHHNHGNPPPGQGNPLPPQAQGPSPFSSGFPNAYGGRRFS